MKIDAANAELRARHLELGYAGKRGGAKRISEELNLCLKAGQFVCLLGPNGVGKSTLIRTLAGMHAPLAGRVSLGAVDLHAMSPKERARAISVVLTDSLPAGLFTAYAVVALGRHPHTSWTGSLTQADRERIRWAMESTDCSMLANRQISELSDGERQKVMIARALAQETSIILLDEPTAFLDLPRRVELMRTLRSLARREGLSVLLSTHDLDLALRSADQLWLFSSDGGIVTGMPEELALKGEIAAAFKSDKLDWDAELGSFRMHREPCVSIFFEGQGPLAIWTRRALHRIGFGVVEAPRTASLSLRIEATESGGLWQLSSGAQEEAFTSLEALIERLSIGAEDVHKGGLS